MFPDALRSSLTPGMEIGPAELVAVLLVAVFVVWVWGNIAEKAGFTRWLCLTAVIPFLNIPVLAWFAFSEWPIHEELRDLREELERAQSSRGDSREARA